MKTKLAIFAGTFLGLAIMASCVKEEYIEDVRPTAIVQDTVTRNFNDTIRLVTVSFYSNIPNYEVKNMDVMFGYEKRHIDVVSSDMENPTELTFENRMENTRITAEMDIVGNSCAPFRIWDFVFNVRLGEETVIELSPSTLGLVEISISPSVSGWREREEN